jgi:hypothetical protein
MPSRNLAAEYRKTLEAQIKLAPQQFMANQTLQPLYQSLALQNTDYLLNGSPELNYTNYTWQKPIYSNTKGAARGGFTGGLFGGAGGSALPSGVPMVPGTGALETPADYFADFGGLSSAPGAIPGIPGSAGLAKLFGFGKEEDKHQLLRKGYWKPEQVKRAAQKGLLQIYEQDILPSQARQASFQRSADLKDVLDLSPSAIAALDATNPGAASLLRALTEQAGDELELGGDLSESMRRAIAQSVRQGQADRGMSFSPSSVFAEAMKTADASEALKSSRRAFASSVASQNQGMYGGLAQMILNRGSNPNAAAGAVSQAGQVGGSAGGPNLNFESNYASDLYNTNFNAAISQAINKANNQTALIGAGIGAVGGLAGGAAMMCWVAREVYGATNARWKQFRRWLLTEAPAALVELYAEHGPALAIWLRDEPGAKAQIRTVMDQHIAELEVSHAV